MQRKIWTGLAGIAAVILAAAILMSVGPVPAAADESRWGANYFPNVELTDQFGHKLRFYDDLLKGKIVVIEQFYTHCIDICPLETARLVQVQKMLGDRVGKDIFFYSLSIDPKRDTAEAMKEYADKYRVGPGWLFLTGNKDDITLINKKLGFRDPEPGDRDGHAPHLLLGNEATGQWLRNNALDNPRYLAIMIGDWMNSWQSARPMVPNNNYADAPRIKFDDQGKYVFFTECAPCHTIGGGESIGPDLRGLTKIRDPQWLRKIIQMPEVLLDQGDPLANALLKKYKDVRMPNLHFDAATTDLLIGYMERQSAAVNAPAATQEANQARPDQPR
jgi:protein SCO1/2